MDTYTLFHEVETRNFKIKNDDRILEFITWCKQMDSKNTENKNTILEAVMGIIDNPPEIIKQMALKFTKDELEYKFIKMLLDMIDNVVVSDDLANRLSEEKSDTFYYIGINEFILQYYTENPNSEWKIKAVLQCGFPFGFREAEKYTDSNISDLLIKNHLINKKWSIYIFTKQSVSTVTLGFDDRNTYTRLSFERKRHALNVKCALEYLAEEGLLDKSKNVLFLAWDERNEDQDNLINRYLQKEEIPVLTNAEYKKLQYSFVKVPSEHFRIDYLDYLSRYKKSVVDIFGYPKQDEKIKKLKNIVEFVNAPGKKSVYPDYEVRKNHVLIKDFFFQNAILKPTVRIGEQNIEYLAFWEEYEIKSYLKNISPYYLYSLLSSELISDFFSEKYDANYYSDSDTPLPLEECIYIEMSSESMCDKRYQEKYERDINTYTKAHAMIKNQCFANKNAKESIEKYLAEIKNDIDVGSFYSATIVMGSVLEAFLIDWLSEIDGKDYSSEDYMIFDKRHNLVRRADLKDYIDEIQKKRPDWIDGAKKATEIRKKRNRIHYKLYIEEGEISQELCYEMLQNLEAIINNRWNK